MLRKPDKEQRRLFGWIMLAMTAVFIQFGLVLACVNNGQWIPIEFEGFLIFVGAALWLIQS